MQLTGVDGQYGIAIVTLGSNIVVKTYSVFDGHIFSNIFTPIGNWW
jgi:hypothetical protein